MSLGSLSAHSAAVEGMLIVPENGMLVTCSTDNTVRVWDYGTGDELQVWRHPDEFRCVALRRAGGQLHVLAGTEQHNIVAFPLFEVIAEQQARREREAAAAAARERLEAQQAEEARQAAAAEAEAEAAEAARLVAEAAEEEED